MKFAISTNDGMEITNDHFGEGNAFLIYEIGDEIKLVERRENTSPNEEHGSSEKAKGISSILSDIPILIGFQFGPNIMRIKNKFLPIVSRERNIEKAVKLLKRYEKEIREELENRRGRAIIVSEDRIRIVEINDFNTKDF